MGRDKATLLVPGQNLSLAQRTAELLKLVASPVLEVGPGRSGLPTVEEHSPGGGPLTAVVAGWSHLDARSWSDPVLVVATDLPLLTEELLRWLADYPSPRSVVPTVDGRTQPLCARYTATDMGVSARLVAQGRRAMNDLLEAIHPVLVEPEDATALQDVDAPEDVDRLPP